MNRFLQREQRRWRAQVRGNLVAATICVGALLLSASAFLGAQAHPSEYQVKAAYLYNFGKFMNWPESGQAEFHLCVLGDDPFGTSLDSTITNATINGKKVAARRLSGVQDAEGCEIAFIASSESGRLERDLAALKKLHVLTVSDMPDFIRRGGIIQFVEEDRKVRFEVNLKAAQESGFTLSSELLKVAAKVQK